MTTRRSLRDRNRASIASDTSPSAEPETTDQAEGRPPAGEPLEDPQAERPSSPAAGPAAAPQRGRARASDGATARLGIYLTPAQFDDAKAAYLADWTNGGTADTFARWIAAAIEGHAARTPAQRATAQPRGRSTERTGSSRSFNIPTDTVARMRAAITADQNAGRWPSDSAWCGEAIGRAVDVARATNGGSLPTPPPRLPNRLVR